MFEPRIRKLYDHLYGSGALKTPAAIGAEVAKVLHTGLYIETVENILPAFDAATSAAALRAAFARMNAAWSLHPDTDIAFADFDLAYVIQHLGGMSLSDPNHDLLGDAVEIFRSDWAKQAGGQFFTDQRVACLAMTLLRFNPHNGDDLVDVCAGTGGFLLAGLARIRRLAPKPSDIAALATQSLKGQEIDAGVAAVANASLKSRVGNVPDLVATGDSLRIDHDAAHRIRLDSHLCIATNPPFGTKITVKDPALLKTFALATHASGNTRKLSVRAPDILFLEKNLRLLKPGVGRMAMVILYQLLSGPQARYVREWLWCQGRVRAVIDLPIETFQPHTGTKASLVLIERRAQPLTFNAVADTHDIFFAVPRWIGHDRRGKTITCADAGDILTDFPAVEAAYTHFIDHGTIPDNHVPTFDVNAFTVSARDVLAEPTLRLNATFYAARATPLPAVSGPPLSSFVQRIFCPGPGGGHGRYDSGGAAACHENPAGRDAEFWQLRIVGGEMIERAGDKGCRGECGDVRAAQERHGAGRTAVDIAALEAASFAVSEHVIRIVPDPSKIDPAYLAALLRSAVGQAYLARGIFGSVINEITPAYVGDMPVPSLDPAAIVEISAAMRAAETARAAAIDGFARAQTLIIQALT